MPWIWFVVAAPTVGGLVALVWWIVRGRRAGLPAGVAAAFTGLAGLLALLVDLLARFVGLPGFQPPAAVIIWLFDYRAVVPLVVGVIALVLLAIPVHARGAVSSADLAPRSMISFARPWWFVVPTAVLSVIVVVTLAAGVASQPDSETGRYDQVLVDGGVGAIGTTIYGWFYSVPALIALAVLIVAVCADLYLIARPPLAEDRELDVRTRRTRTRNVLTAAAAAMLLHLAVVFGSLSATASVQGEFTTSEGPAFLWSPIAGLQTVFTVAAYASSICGIALWATVALSAIPARRHAPTPVPATA
ncbi:UNVERIFIED_CONTAM: hypothetical protein OHV15_05965 [Microbacterium sp. SLM126]